jgi:hypothetical protein
MASPNFTCLGRNMVDLDAAELAAEAFASAKRKTTPGNWYRGAWVERCRRHPDGRHPGFDDPTDPCVITRELVSDGDYSSWVSTEKDGLIGCDSDGPILSQADSEFIVAARNLDLGTYVLELVAEVRRLRSLRSAN